jgi:regulator of cell morphogenesis and NO signaling
MNQFQKMTLSEIVSEHNSAADVFEKYHLNFCCNGEITLKVAMAEADGALEDLLVELELAIESENEENINFNNLSVTEVSEILRRDYHMFLRNKISEIATISRNILSKYKEEKIDLIHDILMAMFNHLAPHMVSEEKVLFPYLEYMEHTVSKGKVPKPASFGKLKKSVSAMLDDHEASATQLDELREITNQYTCWNDADEDLRDFYNELKQLDRNLRMHIFIENYVLFKKARALEDELQAKL